MDPGRIAKHAFKGIRKANARPRGPVTVYLDKTLYKAFQRKCEALGVSASKAIEMLMEEAVKLK